MIADDTMSAHLPDLLAVARGDRSADVLFTGGRVVNVFSGEILSASIAVKDGIIVGLGDYAAEKVVDLGGEIRGPRPHRRPCAYRKRHDVSG